jgi:hypothetical protein
MQPPFFLFEVARRDKAFRRFRKSQHFYHFCPKGVPQPGPHIIPFTPRAHIIRLAVPFLLSSRSKSLTFGEKR